MTTRPRRRRATVYTIDLDHATVESLERGICPERLAQTAHDLLKWRREAIRNTTPVRTYPASHRRPTR